MYILQINDEKFKCEDMSDVKSIAKDFAFEELQKGNPIKNSKLNGEHFEFHIWFNRLPYYKDRNEFNKTLFSKALNESFLFVQYQFHDDRGEWYRKRFERLEKGLSLIKEALEH